MTNYDVDLIRRDFPILERQVYGRPLVYLDNGATTQKPRQVVEAMTEEYYNVNANVHRGVHFLSQQATELHEAARETVRRFLNARSTSEIIFTRGTTESINLVATTFGDAFLNEGDEVIVSEMEHHSNIVSWQLVQARKGIRLRVIPITDEGELCLDEFEQMFNEHTRMVSVTHVSNVLGTVNPVKRIVEIAHAHDVPVLIDGAQSTPHFPVDVQAIDCDFFAFSGHKIYGPTGVGVLYGKESWLDRLPPYMGGGEMVGTVRFTGTTYAPVPLKFEAGTQNIAGAATLKPALELAESLLEDEESRVYSDSVRDYLLDALLSDKRIRLYGVPSSAEEKIPLFSFSVDGVHHEDLALILDKMGVAVRSGQMCAEPLMDRFGVTGMLRASLAPYNTMEEARYFISSLDKAIAMLA